MAFAATPLIVEDGSVVAGADTFVSAADAGQYLYDRGVMTQAQYDAAAMSGALRRGLDALKNLPCLSAYALPLAQSTAIPTGLIEAQIWAAFTSGRAQITTLPTSSRGQYQAGKGRCNRARIHRQQP